VIFVSAVGKIEAGDVHAEAKQVAHGGFGTARRTDGTDNFGAAGDGVRLDRALLRTIGAYFQVIPRGVPKPS
jgi:hypothetical protein